MKRLLLVVLLVGTWPLAAVAEEPKLREAARTVMREYGRTLATVKMTVVQRTLIEKKEAHRTEHRIEVAGTVVSGEGLVAISASALDFLPGLAAEGPLTDETVSTEFERKGARIRFADGKETAAELLGRDDAHDLAFIKPLEKLADIPCLTLDRPHALQAAAPVLVVYPLTRLLGRRPALAVRSVAAVDERARVAVLDSSQLRLLGCPVFDAAGQPAGIATTLRPRQTPHELLSNFENLEPDVVVMDAAAVRATLAEVKKKIQTRK